MSLRACFTLIVLMALSASGCTGIRTLDKAGLQTIPLSELQAHGKKYVGAITTKGKGLIIKVAKGERVPLDVKVLLPFLLVEPGQNKLRFTRETYLFISTRGFMLSPDGEQWARVQDFKALKELFGATLGSMGIGMGVTKEGGTKATLLLVLQ